jgi:hypothetical protein
MIWIDVCMHYQLLGGMNLNVLLKSPLNVKKTGFQSKTNVNSHTRPPIVRFHSIITKYISSSFDGINYDSDPIKQ